MTRESDYRAEISRIERSLAELETSEGFATELVQLQLEERLQEIVERLKRLSDRTVALRFISRDRPGRESMDTALLGALLSRLQSTIEYGTWASHSGPMVTGNVPAAVRRSAATEVVALPAASFGVTLRKRDVEISTSFDGTVDALLDLLGSAVEGHLGDEAGEKALVLGIESSRRLELLMRRVANEDLDTSIEYVSPDRHREVYADRDSAMALAEWLAAMAPETETIEEEGYLRRADTLTGAFKIELVGSGEIIEGSGGLDLLAHREMDALYRATMERTIQVAEHTGRVAERFSLQALEPVRRGETTGR